MAAAAAGMEGKETVATCREMVSYLKAKNRELKAYALARPFSGDEEEIRYFKYYKPALTGRLLYYYRVYQIESGCPGCLRVAETYYRRAMERAERMMERYLPFYQYYHSGATYRDDYYFLRAKGEDLEEPAVRTEAYYQSRPCVKACRRAAEILEEYVKEQKRK